jgi:hypothetical protein
VTFPNTGARERQRTGPASERPGAGASDGGASDSVVR